MGAQSEEKAARGVEARYFDPWPASATNNVYHQVRSLPTSHPQLFAPLALVVRNALPDTL